VQAATNRACARKVLTNATTHEPLNLNSEELAILAELLESERARLLVEIRHDHHRSSRDELRHRLTVVEACSNAVSRAEPQFPAHDTGGAHGNHRKEDHLEARRRR
jgi:hypothetical protein